MLLKLKTIIPFILLIVISGKGIAQIKDSLVVKKRPAYKAYNFMPYTNKVLQLKIDSTYFTKSSFTTKKKYPVFKKANVAKVTVFSHASGNQLMAVHPNNPTDKLFLITDSLAIVNTKMCPPNKADLPFAEIDSLFSVFNNKKVFQKIPGGGSSCFFPRHTILFYDKSNKVIGFVEVCFECDMVLSSSNLKKFFEGNFKDDGDVKLKEIFLGNKINCK
ncbi:MAG: hypothetical protein Q8M29_16760 [Bacteroidota bacterium]|nr:hypothetical protein [Bacteroidota bacterium]